MRGSRHGRDLPCSYASTNAETNSDTDSSAYSHPNSNSYAYPNTDSDTNSNAVCLPGEVPASECGDLHAEHSVRKRGGLDTTPARGS